MCQAGLEVRAELLVFLTTGWVMVLKFKLHFLNLFIQQVGRKQCCREQKQSLFQHKEHQTSCFDHFYILGHGASPGCVHVQPDSLSKKAFRKFFLSLVAHRLLKKLLFSLVPGAQHCRSDISYHQPFAFHVNFLSFFFP